MAWGSFVKGLKNIGNKIAQGAGKASRFIQDKIMPTAKTLAKTVSPFIPYGGALERGVEWLDTATRKGSRLEDSEDLLEMGYEESGLKDWVGKKIRLD